MFIVSTYNRICSILISVCECEWCVCSYLGVHHLHIICIYYNLYQSTRFLVLGAISKTFHLHSGVGGGGKTLVGHPCAPLLLCDVQDRLKDDRTFAVLDSH